jgi:DNA repair protein RecN (Recombination protein N)
MISHLSIRNFAIIDKIDIDLHEGLHVFTGETGAGKSIIIEAVSLALGSRADSSYVQSGKDKARIELTVKTDDPDIFEMMKNNGLETDHIIQISREIYSEGRSTCRINGTPVTVSFLNKLCKKIADIHGQYDHQSLLNPDSHLNLIDEYDKAASEPARKIVKELFADYSETKKRLNKLLKGREDRERKMDFMRYELEEIEKINPLPGEDEEIAKQFLFLQNSETIVDRLAHTYSCLYEQNFSCEDNLGKALQSMKEIQSFSGKIKNLFDELTNCYYLLDDLKPKIRRARESITFSPGLLNEIGDRKDVLDRMKRKYGGTIEKALQYKDELYEKLNEAENIDQLESELSNRLLSLNDRLGEASVRLSTVRKKAAQKMEKCINKELKDLNFQNAALFIRFSALHKDGQPCFSELGIDQVEFLMVTNKGESPKPLAKIASGGEISRIMLAFKQIIGAFDNIPTMVFDEIDSGISGITASIVGQKLKDISEKHQIICVTHLPQIAAHSDHHFLIEKKSDKTRTLTEVFPLDREQKINEIARLLGGKKITEVTRKNAEELIAQASL